MKSITNECLQRLEIYLDAPKGPNRKWLMPRETLVIPHHYISNQVQTLSDRRMITIRNA